MFVDSLTIKEKKGATMFVEHITIYNFQVPEEWDKYKRYSKLMKGWDVVNKGSRTIALEKRESYFFIAQESEVQDAT